MALLDVVIPNYQYGRYLAQCVDSVLSQGIEDIRILIVDNASTDNSVEVAAGLCSKDRRVQVEARPVNLGPHASFNKGIDWAEADYFLLLCSDDLIAPGSMQRALKVLEQNKDVAFAYGNEYTWDGCAALPNIAAFGNDASYACIGGEQFIGSLSMPRKAAGTGSVVTRTRLQKQAGHFRPELRYTCDIEVLMRLACLGNVAKIDAAQFIKRQHGDNISVEFWGDWKAELQHVLDAYDMFFSHEGKRLPDAEALQQHVRRNIAHRAYWAGVSHRLRGLKPQSAALFAFARSTYPGIGIMPPVSYWLRVDNPGQLFARKAIELLRSTFPRGGPAPSAAVNETQAAPQARKSRDRE
jgi:glycosyltransferase involved in cell wall biosynthesis